MIPNRRLVSAATMRSEDPSTSLEIAAFLLDIWFVVAIGSWILRRPYTGWANVFRWVVVVMWLGRIANLAQIGS